jgi:hypothetical protein
LSRTGTRAVRDKYYPKKSEDRIILNFKMMFPSHLRPSKTTCLSDFANYRIVFRVYLPTPRPCAQIIFPNPRPSPEGKRLSSEIIFILPGCPLHCCVLGCVRHSCAAPPPNVPQVEACSKLRAAVALASAFALALHSVWAEIGCGDRA